MSSSNVVNFSVRQNKAIERALVFEGVARLIRAVGRDDYVYVGFGSVWFVDFDAAHRDLGIETMISIEGDEVTFQRALFNKPYRTIEVVPGYSHDVLPELLERADLRGRPWIVWLDYDQELDDTKLNELQTLVTSLPDDSILLTTFNAHPSSYGALADRRVVLDELFGSAINLDPFESNKSLKNEMLVMKALVDAVGVYLKARFVRAYRKGSFVRAFSLQYRDGSPMATAGAVLSSEGSAEAVRDVVAAPDWPGILDRPILTPPLTHREVAALRALLPDAVVERTAVQALGFDLLPEQIQSFTDHYLNYPSFVQTGR